MEGVSSQDPNIGNYDGNIKSSEQNYDNSDQNGENQSDSDNNQEIPALGEYSQDNQVDKPICRSLDSMYNEICRTKSCSRISDENLEKLLAHLQEKQSKQIEEDKYLDAKQTHNVIQIIYDEQRTRKSKLPKLDEKNMVYDEATNKELEKIQVELDEFDKVSDQKVYSLKRHQSKLEEDFETEWRETMPDKYRKPSRLLIYLRSSTPQLAAEGRFDEANAQKIRADNLEAEEIREAKRLLDRDYIESKRKLLHKFQTDMGQLLEKRRLQRELIEAKKKNVQDASANRLFVLRNKPLNTSSLVTKRTVSSQQNTIAFKARSIATKLPPLDPPNPLKPSFRSSA